MVVAWFLLPIPSDPPAVILTLSVAVVALALIACVLLRLLKSQPMPYEQDAQGQLLTSLTEICEALASAPQDPEEWAEILYLELARFLETDSFQLGLFEGEVFNTIFWVRDGNRQENVRFKPHPERDLLSWIRREAEPILIGDYQDERDHLPSTPRPEEFDSPRSGIFVPLRFQEHVVGALSVQSRRAHAFDDHHLRLMNLLSRYVALSLTSAGIRAEIENRTVQFVLLQEISRRLISLQPLPDRLAQIAPLIMETLEAEAVNLYEHLAGDLELRASSRLHPLPEGQQAPPPTTLSRRAAVEKVTLFHNPPREATANKERRYDQEQGLLVVPLKVEDRVLGVLEIQYSAGLDVSADRVAVAEMLASQIAIAMLETRNYAQQQEQAWLTTVLLEVARHAAQPGDAETALHSVLQLTTLLTGTRWAALLLPVEQEGTLRVGPTAGISRQIQSRLMSLRVETEALGLHPPFLEDESVKAVILPEGIQNALGSEQALAMVLSDGTVLLGVLLLDWHELTDPRFSLLGGIAHQISLRLENTQLIEEIAARRSVERELIMARNIQSSFMTKRLPAVQGWEVGVTWSMARQVGGDFYDFIPLPEGDGGERWGIVIADVADKGIPAALYMALCRTLIRSVAMNQFDPGQTLERVNQLLFSDAPAELFVSVFYGVWEPKLERLTFANAGHNPPLLMEPETPARLLREHGMVLGVRPSETYQASERTIAPGQLLVLYTDGVTEATGLRGELFGLHRLENLILGLQDWQAQGVADLISERIAQFTVSAELTDDLTAVVLRHVG